jgi:hypothetical protein
MTTTMIMAAASTQQRIERQRQSQSSLHDRLDALIGNLKQREKASANMHRNSPRDSSSSGVCGEQGFFSDNNDKQQQDQQQQALMVTAPAIIPWHWPVIPPAGLHSPDDRRAWEAKLQVVRRSGRNVVAGSGSSP